MRCRALLVGLLVYGPGSVQAMPADMVVLVRAPSQDHGRWRAAEERTRDELRVMGLGVVELEMREDRAAIERVLAEHGASVAIRVERDGDVGGAEMWWVDPASGELKALRIDGLATGSPAVAALRAAELVYTQTRSQGQVDEEAGARDRSLPAAPDMGRATEVGRASDPGARLQVSAEWPDDAGVPDEAPSPTRLATDDVIDPLDYIDAAPPPVEPAKHSRDSEGPGDRAIGVHASIGGGPGGAGPLIGGSLMLRRDLGRHLAIQGEAEGATSPVWRTAQDLRFRIGLAGARAALVLVARRDARVGWRFGLGGGVTMVWALARAPDRLRSSQDRAVVGVLRASIHAAIRVRARLRLVVGAEVDLLLPPVAVRVQGVEVAKLGTPLVRGVLGLEWDWWSRARR